MDQEYYGISNIYAFTSLPHNGHKTLAEPRKVGLWYFQNKDALHDATRLGCYISTYMYCTCILAASRRHDYIAVAFPPVLSNVQNVPNPHVRRSRTAVPFLLSHTPLKLHGACLELIALV